MIGIALGIGIGLSLGGDTPSAAPLTITADTTKAGSSTNKQFILSLKGGLTYNFTIDWGDGNKETIAVSNPQPHTYAASGVYTIKITENVTGGFPGFYFNGGGDCLKLTGIAQWGGNTWSTLTGAFFGCANLTITATDLPKTSGVAVWDYAFCNCTSLTSFPAMDTSGATSLASAWNGCTGLLSFPALNTAACTSFNATWYNNIGLTSFPAINTAKGTDFTSAWSTCSGLVSFPSLDFTAATTMVSTWTNCTGLTSFPALSLPNVTTLNGAWLLDNAIVTFPALTNTSKVSDWTNAFLGCGFGVFPAIDMSGAHLLTGTWSYCGSFINQPFPALDWHAVTDMTNAFVSSGMAETSYNAILGQLANGAGAIPANVNTGVVANFGNAHYNGAGIAARATLTVTRTWTITDGGTP